MAEHGTRGAHGPEGPEQESATFEQELTSMVCGTLQEWFADYTPPFESDGLQRKVVHHEYTEDGLVVELRTAPDFEPSPQRWRIRVSLEREQKPAPRKTSVRRLPSGSFVVARAHSPRSEEPEG